MVHLTAQLSLFAEEGEALRQISQSPGKRGLRAGRVIRQPNRKLQPAEIEALVADYAAGLGLTALGEKYGLHRQTAKAHLERCGEAIRSEFPTFTAAQTAEVVRLYGQGLGLKPIGKRFGVAPNTVKRLLLRQGFGCVLVVGQICGDVHEDAGEGITVRAWAATHPGYRDVSGRSHQTADPLRTTSMLWCEGAARRFKTNRALPGRPCFERPATTITLVNAIYRVLGSGRTSWMFCVSTSHAPESPGVSDLSARGRAVCRYGVGGGVYVASVAPDGLYDYQPPASFLPVEPKWLVRGCVAGCWRRFSRTAYHPSAFACGRDGISSG